MPDAPSPESLSRLWVMGTAAWGHRWVSNLGKLPIDENGDFTAAGAMWAHHLAGLRERDLLAAIDYFAGRLDWPPSLAEIRRQALGIPSFDAVKADIASRATPFARMVWQYLDYWQFTQANQRDAERMLRAAYDFAVDRRLLGDEPPAEAVAAIAHEIPEFIPATPEQAKRRIDEINGLLHGENR